MGIFTSYKWNDNENSVTQLYQLLVRSEYIRVVIPSITSPESNS